MARKNKGPRREDGYLLHEVKTHELLAPMEFRGFHDEDGVFEVYCFAPGLDEGDRLYGISDGVIAGLRRMFKEWDAAGK